MGQRAALVVLAAATLVACREDLVPNGAWGGEHAALTVTDNGGTVEFDCARGTLDHPLVLDDLGRFSVVGTFLPERGAVRETDAVEKRPARYQGRLERDRVEFTVTLESQTARGPFTVGLGKKPELKKCRTAAVSGERAPSPSAATAPPRTP
jgi:hypothetical protein